MKRRWERSAALAVRLRCLWWLLCAGGLLMGNADSARADVVVIANLSTSRVDARISPITGRPIDITLEQGEVRPVFFDGRSYLSFNSQGNTKRYLLNANSAFRFGNLSDGSLEIEEIGLNGDHSTADGRSLPGSALTAPSVTIPVKILVDEEEPAKQFVWERRLRDRVEKASQILEAHCRLQLKVVAVETWNSDDRISDFFQSLSEFEKEVDPFPGQLAIGFTNQYQVFTGRVHLGGTRGPFHSHILLREWSRHVGEAEKLELLVHELGHYLGAVHIDAPDSVMRPVLGDRKALRAQFKIRFDPINTLIMSLIVEEVRRRHIREFNELSVGTRRRLQQIYARLQEKYPTAPAAKARATPRRVARNPGMRTPAAPPLVVATRSVLHEIVTAAQENHNRPNPSDSGNDARLSGDELTEMYVRRAAQAAQKIRNDVALEAFVYALGIALDDSDTLQKLPATKAFVTQVETTGERSIRLAFLGRPTVHGRRDLAQHFFLSAYLARLNGPEAALSAGLAKEMLDARQGGTGFSFADVAADKAGIRFAQHVADRETTLAQLAQGFSVRSFVPAVENLPEGMTAAQVLAQKASSEGDRFEERLAEIDRLVAELPAYREDAGQNEALDPLPPSP